MTKAELVKELAEAEETIRQQAEIIAQHDKLVYAVCNGDDINAGVALVRAASIDALRARDDITWLYMSNIADALTDLDMETI